MTENIAYTLWNWVCQNIEYRSDNGEYWFFPDETLREMAEDCDGSAILLVSMLREFYPPDRVYAVAGSYQRWGHMWAELDGEILETTYTAARAVADPQNYRAYVKFNDQVVIEMWPGAMSRLFQLARDEGMKLALMEIANGS